MTLQGMAKQMSDGREITYQMALDLIEGEEATASRLGVPTVAQTLATPPAGRISAKDPDWYKKLERMSVR
jgi:hypothetical protein